MAGLNANDVVQVTLIGTLFEQQILSIFHYRLTEPSATNDYMTAIQLFAEGMSTGTNNPTLALLACQSPEYNLDGVRAQRVWPTRDRYYYDVVDLPGTHADACRAPNQAAFIEKYTAGAGRKNTGGLHVGGIPSAQIVDGKLTGAYQALLQVVADRMKVMYSPPLSGMEAFMNIVGKVAGPLNNRVIGTVVQDTVRTMRRRTIGVGR